MMRGNLKGFVFTLDAIFSLIFAAIAVGLLVYINYTGYSPSSPQAGSASSALQSLSHATLYSIANSSPYGAALFGASSGSSSTWPQFGRDGSLGSNASSGPGGPFLLYSFAANGNIFPVPVVSDGVAVFTTKNTIYVINATTGSLISTNIITSNIVSSPVLYGTSVIYANSVGYINARNTSNLANLLWSTNIGFRYVTTPLELVDNYLVFGIKNTSGFGQVYLLDPVNGSMLSNSPTATSNGPLVRWISYSAGTFMFGNSILPGNTIIHNSNTKYIQSSSPPVPNLIPANLPTFAFNTTPSVGGDSEYLLFNGISFETYTSKGLVYNALLPNTPFYYNYSSIALAYGRAYVPNGNTLYVFGLRPEVPGESALAGLASMYLNREGGMADALLYGLFNSSNIGIYINNTYAPALRVPQFNGADGYVKVPSNGVLSPEAGRAGAISLCAWYRINNLPGYHGLIFKGTQNPSSGNIPEFSIDPPAAGGGYNQGFKIYSPSGVAITSVTTPNVIGANSIGQWFFSCSEYNATGSAAYYLNGAKYSTSFSPGTPAGAGTGALIFGSSNAVLGYSNALVVNVQMYNTNLTDQQVSGLYYKGMYGPPLGNAGLVAWWPLLGDTNDYGGSGNTGFPNDLSYLTANVLPTSLLNSYQISKATTSMQLNSNGIYRTYNVSVVLWSG